MQDSEAHRSVRVPLVAATLLVLFLILVLILILISGALAAPHADPGLGSLVQTGETEPNDMISDSGQVYLWLGRDLTGQTVDITAESRWSLDSGSEYGARLGWSADTGDFDGDDLAEALVNARDWGVHDSAAYGRAFVIDDGRIAGLHPITIAASLIVLPGTETAGFLGGRGARR